MRENSKMEINKIKLGLASAVVALGLTGCFTSKPDISGVWVPEHTPKSEFFYSYYVISEADKQGSFPVKKVNYQIQNMNQYNPAKLPKFTGESSGVLTFVKDDTYCYEGSLASDCFVYSDGKLRKSDTQNFFLKTSKNPPEIPVIR